MYIDVKIEGKQILKKAGLNLLIFLLEDFQANKIQIKVKIESAENFSRINSSYDTCVSYSNIYVQ